MIVLTIHCTNCGNREEVINDFEDGEEICCTHCSEILMQAREGFSRHGA